jgi:hypothetical protein
MRTDHGMQQPFARPDPVQVVPGSGLALSKRLFETRGKDLLAGLNLLDRCSVGCIGGMSQNACLDDDVSKDHNWGPYLSFFLSQDDWEVHHARLKQAIQEMPDEVDGVRWRGGATGARKTDVWETSAFLQDLTGFDMRPETAQQWQHWGAYVPPDIHRALLARSLWRVWNVGPNYNLERAQARGDSLTFDLCLARFVEEVLELAFCWNESFVPFFKWRAAHFKRLPICPEPVRTGIERLSERPGMSTTGVVSSADPVIPSGGASLCPGVEESLGRRERSLERPPRDDTPAVKLLCNNLGMDAKIKIAKTIVTSIKWLVKDLYHLDTDLEAPLFVFSHVMHETIEDPEIKEQII